MRVARGADGCDMFGRRIVCRARTTMGEKAVKAKLLHLPYNAIGDEFGAVALARFEISKKKFGPNRREKLAKRHCRGVIVVRGFHARLVGGARSPVRKSDHI